MSQVAAANYSHGNTGFRPQMVANQIRPPGFPPVQSHQNNQNNFHRGNNFNQNRGVEPNCVTCGGTHSYQNCPATSENVHQDNIQEYMSQVAAANYSHGNTGFRPQMVANQIRPPGFPPVQSHQNNQNNFHRGNNFNQNRG
nr:hypothetical protein [Tanacetum cinerariifolium]